MKAQTRQLMSLLADDAVAAIVDELRSSARSAPELVRATGAAQRTVSHALDLLRAHGVVAYEPPTARRRGRPTPLWRLVDDQGLRELERQCDAFKADLLRRQVAEYED